MNAATLIHPPGAVDQFLREAADAESVREERRGEERFELQTSVRATPLNDRMQAAGDPFSAKCSNISSSGISFRHTRAVAHKYLLVEITAAGRRMRLLMEVLRCRHDRRFYEIAGQFVMRLPEAVPPDEPGR